MADQLHIIIKGEWYDRIKTGEKKEEYRELKPFWIGRLIDEQLRPKKYKSILFQRGYRKDAPKMLVEFKGTKIDIVPSFDVHHECFIIELGQIICEMNNKKSKSA